MKKITRLFAVLSTLLLAAGTLSAQPAPPPLRLIVVDMARIYDNHYKTEEINAKFREAEQKAQEQFEELTKQGQAMVDEYKELMEQAKSTLLTAEARSKVETDAQKKFEEIQRKQADVQNFRVNTRNSLQQRLKTHRDLLLEEISKVVNDLAKKKGATLVIDKSGPTLFQIPAVLYADPAYDITEEVLAEVNKDRPPATPAGGSAAATSAPATSAAPAAGAPLFDPAAASQPKKP